MLQPFQNDNWIERNFSETDLGDSRLTQRLCQIVSKIVKSPSASIPKQMGSWSETKSTYDFLNNQKSTHKKVQTIHRKRVKQSGSRITSKEGAVLFIQDGSEADYSSHSKTKGLGQVGNQFGKGILMHNCLAVKFDKNNPEVLGLAHQILWERGTASFSKKNPTFNGGKHKESIVWGQTLRAIGPPPEGRKWVTVCDRGSDDFHFFSEIQRLGWEGVTRAYKDRSIKIDDKTCSLFGWIRNRQAAGTYVIDIRREGETKTRSVEIQLTWGEVTLLPPKDSNNSEELKISVIRCWNELEEIEWILYSTIQVNSFVEAIEKVEWYSCRWIIEEYHKCLKTGCKIEDRYLMESNSLEVLIGILSVVAVLLLQMRNYARDEEMGKQLAVKFVPEIPLILVCNRLKVSKEEITVRNYWRGIAQMGGFLGRKSDGEPGWQTLWKGWLELINMWTGVELFKNATEGIFE